MTILYSILVTLVIYAIWLLIGLGVLTPRVDEIVKMPDYRLNGFHNAAYQLTLWPKVLHDINKEKK